MDEQVADVFDELIKEEEGVGTGRSAITVAAVQAQNHVENRLDCLTCDLELHHVGSIKAIYAVRPEYATLGLDHFPGPKGFHSIEAKPLLAGTDLIQQLIDFVKLISMCFLVEIIPNVMYFVLEVWR